VQSTITLLYRDNNTTNKSYVIEPTYRVIKIKKHCNIAIIEYDATITLLYRDNNTTNKLHHIHQ